MKYSKKSQKITKKFWGLMLSHVDPIEKIWETLEQVAVSDEQKPDISNMMTCDYMRKCLSFVHLTSQLAPKIFKYLS